MKIKQSNNFIICRELVSYSAEDLEAYFKLSKSNLDDYIDTNSTPSLSFKQVISNYPFDKIIKCVYNSKNSDLSVDDLQDYDDFDVGDENEAKVNYYFKFVGLICINGVNVLVYPKYMSDAMIGLDANISIEDDLDQDDIEIKDDLASKNQDNHIPKLASNDSAEASSIKATDKFKQFKQVISVIRKYKNSLQQNKNVTKAEAQTSSKNLLDITLELFLQFYEHGLYCRNLNVFEVNGPGEILWDKTIDQSECYLTDSGPVYLDLLTHNAQENQFGYFKRLHACVLTQLSAEFADIIDLLDLPPIDISNEDLSSFGESEYILYRLNNEISNQFITDKLYILNLLKAYIDLKSNVDKSNQVNFIGTTAFNLVWEDVCQTVLGNVKDLSFSEIVKLDTQAFSDLTNLQSKNLNNQLLLQSLQDSIHKPAWQLSEKKPITQSTLIPDVISCTKVKNTRPSTNDLPFSYKISIYDAKYYNVRFTESRHQNNPKVNSTQYNMELKGNPGIQDIVKQYVYAMSLQALITDFNHLIDTVDAITKKSLFKIDSIVENVFIFPREIVDLDGSKVDNNSGVIQERESLTMSGSVDLSFFSGMTEPVRFEYRQASFMFQKYLEM